MALPTSLDLIGLDVAAGGMPFVQTATPTFTTALPALDTADAGMPFVANASDSGSGNALISQVAVETLRDNTDPGGGNLRVTAVAIEQLIGDFENVYVTHLAVERLSRFTSSSALVGKGKSWMVFDEDNHLDIYLGYGAAPTSAASKVAVLNGANLALWGSELIGFRDVASLGSSRYRLSCLLRGRFGTEWAMNAHNLNDQFVVLSLTTVRRITQDEIDLGVNKFYRGVTLGQTLEQSQTRGFVNTGVGLKPYAPCHVVGARDGGDNLTITWFRRTRYSGEWRDAVDVGVGESVEAYEVDILSGAGVVLRTITDLTSPSASYTAAQQTTDFGSPQSSIAIVVYQLSGIVGRGYGTSIVV